MCRFDCIMIRYRRPFSKQEKFEDIKGVTGRCKSKNNQDKMAKRQLVIYKTLHRKLNIRQQVPHKRPVVNSGAPEG